MELTLCGDDIALIFEEVSGILGVLKGVYKELQEMDVARWGTREE